MPGYSGMGPRRLRPMIVGVPLEPGVGGMGGMSQQLLKS